MGRMRRVRGFFRTRRIIIDKVTGKPITDVTIQKNKEIEALKDPLANSTNRGQEINKIENSFNDVGLEDNIDFTKQLNKTSVNKDKLKRMLSL